MRQYYESKGLHNTIKITWFSTFRHSFLKKLIILKQNGPIFDISTNFEGWFCSEKSTNFCSKVNICKILELKNKKWLSLEISRKLTHPFFFLLSSKPSHSQKMKHQGFFRVNFFCGKKRPKTKILGHYFACYCRYGMMVNVYWLPSCEKQMILHHKTSLNHIVNINLINSVVPLESWQINKDSKQIVQGNFDNLSLLIWSH